MSEMSYSQKYDQEYRHLLGHWTKVVNNIQGEPPVVINRVKDNFAIEAKWEEHKKRGKNNNEKKEDFGIKGDWNIVSDIRADVDGPTPWDDAR